MNGKERGGLGVITCFRSIRVGKEKGNRDAYIQSIDSSWYRIKRAHGLSIRSLARIAYCWHKLTNNLGIEKGI